MTYFFILGNNPTLSIAEIIKVIHVQENDIKEITSEFLILETRRPVNVDNLQKRLAGTIKIGQVMDKIEPEKNNLPDKIIDILSSGYQRVNFGFSFYNPEGRDNIIKGKTNPHVKNFDAGVKKISLEIKRRLKEKDISSRWIESSEEKLSSVVVKNNLLDQGMEIVFLFSRDAIFLGRTLSCQLFEEYGHRDFNRPIRVIKKGMIPPKLARIMINLGAKDDSLIRRTCFLDPFCGTGTILQEALLMDFGNIIGTDKNKRIVIDAQTNLGWLAKTTQKELDLKKIKIFYCDARRLSSKIKEESIGLVVTEPYLGPIKFNFSDNQFIIRDLTQLYFLTFRELRKIVKRDGRVVIIFPIFSNKKRFNPNGKTEEKDYFIRVLDQLKKIGWETENPIPDYLLKNKVINVTKRNSIIYSRPDQKVLREILIFRRNY